MRSRVCPISGPGLLSKSERERRGREIVAKSGADTVEYFNEVVQQQKSVVAAFRQQADHWLERLRNRKRKPLASGTIEDWERTLRNWINPHIGDCPISDVNNGVLKQLVAAMSKAGLSPKSIENYLQVPKMVVASVTDDDGNHVYPRKWNHEFIDLPIVEQSEQNRPSFSPETMTGLATYRPRVNRCSSSSLAQAGSASVRRLGSRSTNTCRLTARLLPSSRRRGTVAWNAE